jgi:hypothetical protein
VTEEAVSAAAFRVHEASGERAGAYASFPYDRGLVKRFRSAFPRARWQEEGCWFVPGVRAAARLNSWIAAELADLDRHGDAKGRDDFAFEPLSSRYLEPAGDDLLVRTPYSRTVVEELRAVPWARWDPEAKAWRVPYRSYDELRRRWPAIEDAAARNEPEARKARTREPLDEATKRRRTEQRRRRYPVPAAMLPPPGEPVATGFGVLVFDEVTGEEVDAEAAIAFPHVEGRAADFTWGHWRLPTFRELRRLRPAAARDPDADTRGWWPPTDDDVDARRDTLRRVWRRRDPEQRIAE